MSVIFQKLNKCAFGTHTARTKFFSWVKKVGTIFIAYWRSTLEIRPCKWLGYCIYSLLRLFFENPPLNLNNSMTRDAKYLSSMPTGVRRCNDVSLGRC